MRRSSRLLASLVVLATVMALANSQSASWDFSGLKDKLSVVNKAVGDSNFAAFQQLPRAGAAATVGVAVFLGAAHWLARP